MSDNCNGGPIWAEHGCSILSMDEDWVWGVSEWAIHQYPFMLVRARVHVNWAGLGLGTC